VEVLVGRAVEERKVGETVVKGGLEGEGDYVEGVRGLGLGKGVAA